jgi:hypothetical protein
MKWWLLGSVVLGGFAGLAMQGCDYTPSSDKVQQAQQEAILREATSQTGMPAIKNFRERKIMKDILELRDQEGLTTYTYVFNELKGELRFVGESIGYAIPYGAQYTNPEKVAARDTYGVATLPQADPNGLFSPASAEGSWVLMKNPHGKEVRPVYFEPRIVVSPFKLQ